MSSLAKQKSRNLNKPITLERKGNDGLPAERGRSKSPSALNDKRSKSPGAIRNINNSNNGGVQIPRPDVGSPTVRTLNNGSKPIITPQSLFSPKNGDSNVPTSNGSSLKRYASVQNTTKASPIATSKRLNPPQDGFNPRKSTFKSLPATTSLLNGTEEEEIVAKTGLLSNKYVVILTRFAKVLSSFPFVIIVATLDLSTSYSMLRSAFMVRCMNLMIYILPVLFVTLILSKTNNKALQTVAMGFYIGLYLTPVGMNVLWKLKVSASSSKIEEGTFCFKPARSVRMSTSANIFAMSSIIMEWMQHCLYVLPLGIVSSKNGPATLSSFPPYLPFIVYYWSCVASVAICAMIVILNAVLRGKSHYRLQRSDMTWYFLFNFAGSLYVTVVTILFMGFWCTDKNGVNVLVQDDSIVCWEGTHTRMAIAGLICLAIYLIQNTLLPAGTFKETMRDNDLEIMFVPVYLQGHFFLKSIFCGIYVTFYFHNWVRIIVLTGINLFLLALNNGMKPCSVEWVNVLRDTFFMHASLSGIQALNYLAWPVSDATTGLLVSTLCSNILFVCLVMYIYFIHTSRSTEYSIANAFLDLEWQVSRGGFVHPRVLEPLISLTLSTDELDWVIAKKYVGQLVWLISYPNMRVQFQSAWGLANLALCDNDARVKIHEAGGTKSLFEWYLDMEFVVQLEALAALTNLTLSPEVVEVMVTTYGCIPFFLGLAASSKLKHAQFATIAVGNIAQFEVYRETIRKAGGMQILVGCIMSHDYSKRKYGCLALGNLALSNVAEIAQVWMIEYSYQFSVLCVY